MWEQPQDEKRPSSGRFSSKIEGEFGQDARTLGPINRGVGMVNYGLLSDKQLTAKQNDTRPQTQKVRQYGQY